jgi:hypothetical protein
MEDKHQNTCKIHGKSTKIEPNRVFFHPYLVQKWIESHKRWKESEGKEVNSFFTKAGYINLNLPSFFYGFNL